MGNGLPIPIRWWAPIRTPTMINGLGVLGWGVGGIRGRGGDAGAGCEHCWCRRWWAINDRKLREGATATDLVLTG